MSKERRYVVRIGKRRGLMDESGRVIVSLTVDGPGESNPVHRFDDGCGGEGGVWPSRCIRSRRPDGWGFIDFDAQPVGDTYDQVKSYRGDLAIVGVKDDDSMKYGVIDAEGRVVLSPTNVRIKLSAEGPIVAYPEEKKCLLYRRDGSRLSDEVYVYGGAPGDGIVPVTNAEAWGAVDYAGKQVLAFSYYAIDRLGEGLIATKAGGELVGFLDHKGEQVLEAENIDARAMADGLVCVLRDPPDAVLKPKASRTWIDTQLMRQAQRWGALNRDGEMVIPLSYKSLGPFAEGLAPFEDENAWGYINAKGDVVVGAQYSSAEPFCEGRAVVSGGRVIDRNGSVFVKADLGEMYPEASTLERLALQQDVAVLDHAGDYGAFADLDGPALLSLRQFIWGKYEVFDANALMLTMCTGHYSDDLPVEKIWRRWCDAGHEQEVLEAAVCTLEECEPAAFPAKEVAAALHKTFWKSINYRDTYAGPDLTPWGTRLIAVLRRHAKLSNLHNFLELAKEANGQGHRGLVETIVATLFEAGVTESYTLLKDYFLALGDSSLTADTLARLCGQDVRAEIEAKRKNGDSTSQIRTMSYAQSALKALAKNDEPFGAQIEDPAIWV